MKAQCCICADLFENSADIKIAAAPCGHTFHEQCLMQWIEKSSTCPSCRIQVKQNKVIRRLYFDIREDDGGEEDSAELINQNATLKAQIKQVTKDKKDLAEERDSLAVALARSESEKDFSLTQAKDAESKCALIKRELVTKEKLISSYKQELREFVDVQRRLKELQHISALLKEAEHECAVYTKCYSGGGETSIQQLSQMMAIVKREYDKALSDKKCLREQVEALKADGASCKEELVRTKRVLKVLQKRVEKADQEVFSLERKNNEKRRKIVHLRSALKYDKSEGSQSFMAAVNEDSPNVAYSPVMTSAVGTDDHAKIPDFMNTSSDLFDDDAREGMPKAWTEGELRDDGIITISSSSTPVSKQPKLQPFVSASDKFQSVKQAKVEEEKNAPPSCPISKFSIMQKKVTGVSTSQRCRTSETRAYNGFGGSGRADSSEPLGPSKAALVKFAPKKSARKRNPLTAKDHSNFNKPFPVNRLFKNVLTAKPSSSSMSTSSTSTSFKTPDTIPNPSKVNTPTSGLGKVAKRSRASQSAIIEKFAKIHKPMLAKSVARNEHAVIDLTEDSENNGRS